MVTGNLTKNDLSSGNIEKLKKKNYAHEKLGFSHPVQYKPNSVHIRYDTESTVLCVHIVYIDRVRFVFLKKKKNNLFRYRCT